MGQSTVQAAFERVADQEGQNVVQLLPPTGSYRYCPGMSCIVLPHPGFDPRLRDALRQLFPGDVSSMPTETHGAGTRRSRGMTVQQLVNPHR